MLPNLKFFAALISFYSLTAFAVIPTTEILEISSSGSSILVDRGYLEGVKVGDKATLVIPRGRTLDPKFEYYAEGVVIKSNANQSYWLLQNIDKTKLVRPGQKINYISKNQVLKGRSPFRVKRKKIVLRRGQTPLDSVNEGKQGVPEDLIQNKNIEPSAPIVTNQSESLKDIEVTDFDQWQVDNKIEYVEKYLRELESKRFSQRSKVKSKKVQEKENEDVFKAVVKSTIQKTNNLEGGLPKLYEYQKSDKEFKQLNDRPVIHSVYDQAEERRNTFKRLNPKVYQRIQREGELWSASMSDDRLRKFMLENGIAEERLRRKRALEIKGGNEVLFFYSNSLSRNSTEEDVNNQGSDYSLGFSYEYHFARTFEHLENFTFEFGLQRGVSYYDVGGQNGRFQRGSFYGNFYFYLVNSPQSVDKYMWFIGTGFKRGNATVSVADASQSYTYQLIGFPSYHFGFKYRFRAGDEFEVDRLGMGVMGKITLERLSLTSIERLFDDIDSSIKLNDLKFTIGMSLYF